METALTQAEAQLTQNRSDTECQRTSALTQKEQEPQRDKQPFSNAEAELCIKNNNYSQGKKHTDKAYSSIMLAQPVRGRPTNTMSGRLEANLER